MDEFEIVLGNGTKVMVDKIDHDLQNLKWCYLRGGTSGYAIHYTHGTYQLMHRVIIERAIGRRLNKSEIVDHVDGNGLNNQRNNLRIASHIQNMRNRHKHSNNKSGYKGVYKRKGSNIWTACIRIKNKSIHLGNFTTAEDAHMAYCNAAESLFGEFARLN